MIPLSFFIRKNQVSQVFRIVSPPSGRWRNCRGGGRLKKRVYLIPTGISLEYTYHESLIWNRGVAKLELKTNSNPDFARNDTGLSRRSEAGTNTIYHSISW